MQILKVIGLLMEYPDELLWECKDDALALIRRDAPMLTDFTCDLLNAPLLDKQAEWCEVFDRGRTTSLLLFEHVHAESRDRGQAMVDLLAEYEKVGLQLDCRELPDYLPLYLEYLSVLPDDQAKDGLLNVAPILALLGGRLKQRGAAWYALFDALLQLAGSPLSSDSVTKQIRSEERDDTRQALDKRGMVLWSNLFHIGILGIFFGHLFGMLTPHWMYAWFLPVAVKQQMAMILGGICGVLTLAGGAGLLVRRLTNPRIRATSSSADILILIILLIQCILGLTTIPFSAQHPDGSEMMKLVGWAQSVVTFQGGASTHLDGVAFIFRVHLVLGMTIFLLFPFTRLVHVWSAPFEYFTRRYQIVRSRR